MTALPAISAVLAVCAHPDDESFGLGGVLSALTEQGTVGTLVCLTRGEASSLGAGADLGTRRAEELAKAAAVLGLVDARLLDYRDGHLLDVRLSGVVDVIRDQAAAVGAEALLVFDEGGVTGHPDHRRATAAALLAAELDDLAVLAWTIPAAVAEQLNAEFGTAFVGRRPDEIDTSIPVDRSVQRDAIACHTSQASDNAVLWRRLELLGDTERLRYLRRRSTEPRQAGPRDATR